MAKKPTKKAPVTRRSNGYGRTAFADTIELGIDRANVRFLLPPDSALYLTSYSRSRINEKAEWLWQNFGIVKEGVAGIARHTVGKGISLQIDSDDDEWNQLAEDDFENYALTPERCDLSGRRDFYEAQTAAIEQRIIRGEFICAKSINPEWKDEPCFQIFDSEECRTPKQIPEGVTILDGVEVNDATRAIKYHFRGIDNQTYYDLPREQIIHWYKPHSVNQVRGISDLAQAVNGMVDIHELKRLTTRSAKAQQLIALILKGVGKKKARGAMGAITSAGNNGDGTPDANTAQLEQLAGGAGAGIAYLDAEGDAKMISPNSPTPLVEGFISDLLLRDASASLGVMSDFLWNPRHLGGATMRFVLSRADLMFQVLGGGLITRFCTPIAFRYLDHRIKIGEKAGGLRPCKDPNWSLKMSWQTPPRVTVDNGNEGTLQIELLANGLITLRQYCNARGLNYRHEMRQWIREPLEFVKILQQELSESDLDAEQQKAILDRAMSNLPIWRAGKPGAGMGQPNDQQAEPAPNAKAA